PHRSRTRPNARGWSAESARSEPRAFQTSCEQVPHARAARPDLVMPVSRPQPEAGVAAPPEATGRSRKARAAGAGAPSEGAAPLSRGLLLQIPPLAPAPAVGTRVAPAGSCPLLRVVGQVVAALVERVVNRLNDALRIPESVAHLRLGDRAAQLGRPDDDQGGCPIHTDPLRDT